MIRILIADDHPILREGLRTLLKLGDDFEVVGEAEHEIAQIERGEPMTPASL